MSSSQDFEIIFTVTTDNPSDDFTLAGTGIDTMIINGGGAISLIVSSIQFPEYNFSVTNNTTNCQSLFNVSSPDCFFCEPNAGTMSQDLIVVCDGEMVESLTQGEILEEGQILSYILHTQPIALGDILGQNENGQFFFSELDSAQYFVEYYISAIVSYTDETGNLLLEDGCTIIAEGTPIVFYPIIDVQILSNECLSETSQDFEVKFIISVEGANDQIFSLEGTNIEAQNTTINDTISLILNGLTSSYEVLVSTVSGTCQTAFMIDSPVCFECQPIAGTMPTELLTACFDGRVQATTEGSVLENGQVLAYVAHSNSTDELGTILGQNLDGAFIFSDLNSANYYNEYYISAVVGYPDEDGFPILNDACTVVSVGTPFVFFAPISFDIDEYCDFSVGDYVVTVTVRGGYPEFDNSTTYSLSEDYAGEISFGESITVIYPVNSLSFYKFSVADDEFGCVGATTENQPFSCIKTPIEWLSFEGETLNNGNLLKWTTASESNNEYIDIQRSTDGINFKTIGRVEGQGTTLLATSYTFLDKNAPNGVAYYRLNQLDFNGKNSLSNTINLLRKESQLGIVDLFPNPAIDKLNLLVNVTNNQPVTIHIYDIAGREVLTKKQDTKDGLNTLNFNLSTFKSGIYLLKINDGLKVSMTKFLKQ